MDKRTVSIFELIDNYAAESELSEEEIQKKLDELNAEMEKNITGGYRFRAIAEVYGMDKPRITLEEVIAFIEGF